MNRQHICYNAFSDWKFDVLKAERSFLWDQNGKKLIDFTSGWNVTNLGWNHPELTEAVCEQAKKNTYAPMWAADPIQIEYASALTSALPKELCVVGRATGGTEANEEAIKTARGYTKRKKILGLRDTYHGQSVMTMSIGYPEAAMKAIGSFEENFVQMPYPIDLENWGKELEKVLAKEDIAAMVTEAGIITGQGNCFLMPDGYLTLVRKLTKKYGTLLILDEVGTGFSRCGKLFGMQCENVVPDMATFAKGMVNGVAAIGAMVTTEEIANKTYETSNITSTFGWTPIACAAAKKVLEIHQRERLWEKAEQDGKYLRETLQKSCGQNPNVESIHGKGMEIAIRFKNTKVSELVDKAYQKGLHLVCDLDKHIQIMPPLTVSREILDQGMDILTSLLA